MIFLKGKFWNIYTSVFLGFWTRPIIVRDFTVYKKLPQNPVRKLVEQYPIAKFPKQTRRLKRYSCFPLRNPSSISSLQTHFFDNSFRLPYIEPFHSTKSWKFKRDSTPIESPVSLTEKSFLSYVHVFTALKIHHQISSFSFSLFLFLLPNVCYSTIMRWPDDCRMFVTSQ